MQNDDDDPRPVIANPVQPAQSQASNIYFDKGRASAMSGLDRRANPYLLDIEPDQHKAWLDGHASFKDTR